MSSTRGNRGGPDDGGVCDITARSSHTDAMSITDFGILHDRDLVSIRQESIEFANEEGVTVEEVSYSLDDARCVDPTSGQQNAELEGNDTHSWPLKSFIISRNKLYTSGLC
jgi:hypothetical protein